MLYHIHYYIYTSFVLKSPGKKVFVHWSIFMSSIIRVTLHTSSKNIQLLRIVYGYKFDTYFNLSYVVANSHNILPSSTGAYVSLMYKAFVFQGKTGKTLQSRTFLQQYFSPEETSLKAKVKLFIAVITIISALLLFSGKL